MLLAEGAPNTGTFVWTPATDLEDDVTHYGLQLIADNTGFYQWSTQFGISNKRVTTSSTTVAETSTTTTQTTAGIDDATTSTDCTSTETETSTIEITSTSTTYSNATMTTITIEETDTTTVCPSSTEEEETSTSTTYVKPTTEVVIPSVHTKYTPTYTPSWNTSTTTIIKPTISTISPPISTGAADRNMVSLGMGVVAVAAVGLGFF